MTKDYDWLESCVHLCTLLTIIMVIWTIIDDKVNTFNIFLKAAVIIITGVGAIGIYIPIAFRLIELKEKYGK